MTRDKSKKLCSIKGLSENKVAKLQESAKKLVPMGFSIATEALQKQRIEIVSIATGFAIYYCCYV
jgi:DNA repair protein RAD51